MRRRAPDSPETEEHRIPVPLALSFWYADREAAGCRPRAVDSCREFGRLFTWWLDHEYAPYASDPVDLAALTPDVIRRFLAYVREPHPTGRWGRDHPECRRAASPNGVHKHWRNLRAFIRFCIRDDLLPEHCNPLARLTPPRSEFEQREPLAEDEIRKLLAGARRSVFRDRDVAVVLLLLDTGLRASELCGLTIRDALSADMSAEVVGKRGKRRVVFWSAETAKALRRYLAKRGEMDVTAPLFVTRTGRPFTAANVHEVVSDAAVRGNVGRPVFPHLLRHTAALALLRGGATLFEVQRLLGHADLTILRRYVLETREDLQAAHRRASPVASMFNGRNGTR